MAKRPDPIQRSRFASEAEWLNEYARFYGTVSSTTFSEEDLHGVTLVQVFEALIKPSSIRCEKCDEPGTVCVIEACVGDGDDIFVKVHFDSQQVAVTILEAGKVEEADRDDDSAA